MPEILIPRKSPPFVGTISDRIRSVWHRCRLPGVRVSIKNGWMEIFLIISIKLDMLLNVVDSV